MQPFLIGIGGCSGSGKSELARCLTAAMPQPPALLALDSYYNELGHLTYEERCACNFDHPDSLDWDLAIRHVDALSRGESVEEPVYLFDTHTRSTATRIVAPAAFVLVEGILALHHEEVRRRLDLKVYVETHDDECFRRRLHRDTQERGRTAESVHRQYNESVKPMAARFVIPSRQYADLIVSGIEPLDTSVAAVLGAVAPASAGPRRAISIPATG